MRSENKELYKLDVDIGEMNNLADQYPEKVKSLSILISKNLKDWKSPMPVVRSTGIAVRLPDDEL
ncbi:MAG: hypothetical protein WBD22_14835 [Pyrinomonadaceae bacterium]